MVLACTGFEFNRVASLYITGFDLLIGKWLLITAISLWIVRILLFRNY
jgi:hypothetical protein